MTMDENILANYRFDIRDFTTSQTKILRRACLSSRGRNKEFANTLNSEIVHQQKIDGKYFNKIRTDRERAYKNYVFRHLLSKIGLSEELQSRLISWTSNWSLQTLVKSKSKAESEEADQSVWSDVPLNEEIIESPHIIAGMPLKCEQLNGWERVKRAFLPLLYVPPEDKEGQPYNFNIDSLRWSTLATGVIVGVIQGIQHGQVGVKNFKKAQQGDLYESTYSAIRSKHNVFIKSSIRYGYRWAWRAAFIYSVMYVVSQSLTIYKMKEKASHYMIGAGVAIALYKWTCGPVGMLGYGLMGSIVVGVPVGFLFGTLKLNPRPAYYYSTVDSRYCSSHHESNWTPDKVYLSNLRLLALLNLIRTQFDIGESNVYHDLFKK